MDIVERLQGWAGDRETLSGERAVYLEAADEILRLRQALEAETEECAKVAENISRVKIDWPIHGLVEPHEPTRIGIASAIRSRKKTEG